MQNRILVGELGLKFLKRPRHLLVKCASEGMCTVVVANFLNEEEIYRYWDVTSDDLDGGCVSWRAWSGRDQGCTITCALCKDEFGDMG